MSLTESIVEDAALEWFRLRHLVRLGYAGKDGYGGHVGESTFARAPGSGLRRALLRYAVGHGTAFAELRCTKLHFASVQMAAFMPSPTR